MRSADEQVAAIARATARERLLVAAERGEEMDRPPDQLTALVDTARTLSEAGIRFALIGGIAVGIRSNVPRATDDVDVGVSTAVQRRNVVDSLTEAGFELRGEHEHSVNFRHPNGEPVQVSLDAFLDELIARAEAVEIGGVEVPVLTTEDLIASKERAASDPARRKSKALRDRADVELLRGDRPDPDEGW